MKETKISPAGLQMLHDYMESLEAENKLLRKHQQRLEMKDKRCDKCLNYIEVSMLELRLRNRIEELELDKERLEWMVKTNRDVFEFEEGWSINDGGGMYDPPYFKDWRDAIDEAMMES